MNSLRQSNVHSIVFNAKGIEEIPPTKSASSLPVFIASNSISTANNQSCYWSVAFFSKEKKSKQSRVTEIQYKWRRKSLNHHFFGPQLNKTLCEVSGT